MKRFWGHVFATVVSLAGIATVEAACAHNDQSIYIQNVMSPPSVGVGTMCTYTADPTLPIINSGTLDVGIHTEYDAVLLVANQLVSQANPDEARTESDSVELQDVIVTVETAGDLIGSDGSKIAGGTTLISYKQVVAGFISPGTGTTPSYGLLQANILAFDRITAPLAVPTNGGTITLVSHVTVQGQTLGLTNVETNEFDFPVDICKGCLVTFPSGSDDPTQPASDQPNCKGSLTASTTGTTIIQPCVLGQDQPVDCRLCQGDAVCDPAQNPLSGED